MPLGGALFRALARGACPSPQGLHRPEVAFGSSSSVGPLVRRVALGAQVWAGGAGCLLVATLVLQVVHFGVWLVGVVLFAVQLIVVLAALPRGRRLTRPLLAVRLVLMMLLAVKLILVPLAFALRGQLQFGTVVSGGVLKPCQDVGAAGKGGYLHHQRFGLGSSLSIPHQLFLPFPVLEGDQQTGIQDVLLWFPRVIFGGPASPFHQILHSALADPLLLDALHREDVLANSWQLHGRAGARRDASGRCGCRHRWLPQAPRCGPARGPRHTLCPRRLHSPLNTLAAAAARARRLSSARARSDN